MKNQARHFGRLRRAEMCTAYIFILPMFAGLLLFSIIPFIQNILYSFRKMGTFGEGTFIGLKNYQDLLKDDTFWLALQNTVFYAVVGVPLVIIFSIFLAHQINKKIRGRTIYRTLLFIPAITIPAAIGIYWVASSAFQLLQQLIVNSYLNKVDMDDLIRKNVEKANKNRAKKGLPPQKVNQNATASLKHMEAVAAKEEAERAEKIEKTKKQVEQANSYYNKNAKPGSLASKANMVARYNEKHNNK